MRKFKLINADGQEFDLMRKDAFFSTPSGLGFKKGFDIAVSGYSFIETDNVLEQKEISGEMIFKGYKEYNEFSKFITKLPLKLCYKPLDTWYYIDCKVSQLDKDEISYSSKRLICKIDYLCFSQLYKDITVTKSKVGDDGKIYNYSYPFKYVEPSTGIITIINESNIDSPCILHIMGPCVNPSYSLIQSGVVKATGKINKILDEGRKLVIDSNPNNMEIAEYTINNEYINSLYGFSDFTTARFIYFPPGESTLQFSHEGSTEFIAFTEVRLLAETF